MLSENLNTAYRAERVWGRTSLTVSVQNLCSKSATTATHAYKTVYRIVSPVWGKHVLFKTTGTTSTTTKTTKYIRSSFSGEADCNQDHQQPFFFNRSSALRFRTRQKRTCSPLVTLKVKETFWTRARGYIGKRG